MVCCELMQLGTAREEGQGRRQPNSLLRSWTLSKAFRGLTTRRFEVRQFPFGLHGGLFERHKDGKQIKGAEEEVR